MPEVQEVFRMATQKVRPEPGALERQFQGQRRRSARRKTAAVGLVAALVIGVGIVAIQMSRDTGRSIPGGEGQGKATATPLEPMLTVDGEGNGSTGGSFGFSSDGRHLFARVDQSTRGVIYDAESGELLQTVVAAPGEGMEAFSPDGARFVTAHGGSANEVYTAAYDTATGDKLWRVRGSCCFASFSPDGRLLALSFVGVIDAETGEPVNELGGIVGPSAFSPDGQQLLLVPAFGGEQNGIVGYVYDVQAQGKRPVLTLHGPNGAGFVPAWSPDGSMLATPVVGDAVLVWDATTGNRMFRLEGSPVAFGPDSDLIAVGSDSLTVTVYRVSGQDAQPILTLDAAGVVALDFSPDGTRLMISMGSSTQVWDIHS